jgi:hypothetical protein
MRVGLGGDGDFNMSLRLEELLPSMAKTDRQARKLIKTGMK